jgi:hypothetical protein
MNIGKERDEEDRSEAEEEEEGIRVGREERKEKSIV